MFLVELAAILVAAKLAGDLASRLGQPPVLGQLVAGLALGAIKLFVPSGVGLAGADPQVAELANLGVLLLMFLAGLETDWKQLLTTGKAAFISASAGVAIPLLAGWGLGMAFGLPSVEALFVGVILTATSVSITAQTLMELGSLQTVEGSTVLGAAVIDDVIGLLVFSFAIAFTGAGHTNLPVLLIGLALFFGACFLIGARVLAWVLSQADRLRGGEAALAVALAAALVLAFLAEKVGIAAITGAYVAGLLINRDNAFAHVVEKVRVLAAGLFVPVFLVKTGMDAPSTGLASLLGFVLVVSLLAVLAKIVGCGLGARLSGLTTAQSLVVGVGMISRGEVALIVASLAMTAGVISHAILSATVLVVVVTTLITPPLLRLTLRRVPATEGSPLLAEAV
ncbi:MAG: cation:proton antiporter [Chloroflexota bacterium]